MASLSPATRSEDPIESMELIGKGCFDITDPVSTRCLTASLFSQTQPEADGGIVG
jgi:hypothetical protein